MTTPLTSLQDRAPQDRKQASSASPTDWPLLEDLAEILPATVYSLRTPVKHYLGRQAVRTPVDLLSWNAVLRIL